MGEAPTSPAELDAYLFRAFFGEREGEVPPPFSTDLQAAWVLVQKLLTRHQWVEVVGTNRGRWICRIHDPTYADPHYLGSVSSEASSAPLAICRAASKTMGRASTGGVGPVRAAGA